jgi:hypothetical protein
MDRIPDSQFVSLVLLIAADQLGINMVRMWHAADPARAESAILTERRFQVDPSDAAGCARVIAELIAEAAG